MWVPSERCEHFPDYETRNGRRLFHSSVIEEQISIAQNLSMEKLLVWARGDIRCGGVLREETLVFLISEFTRTDQTEKASDLSSILHGRVYARTMAIYRPALGAARARQFAADLCSDFWATVLDPNSSQSVWAQICFWTVVLHLAANALNKERIRARRLPSFDSDLSTIQLVKQLQSRDTPLEDRIYAKEVLARLNPLQRAAFVLRYSSDESAKEIGSAIGRSTSSVKNYLRGARTHLPDAA